MNCCDVSEAKKGKTSFASVSDSAPLGTGLNAGTGGNPALEDGLDASSKYGVRHPIPAIV